jgi:DnaJ-class molecular chaperone
MKQLQDQDHYEVLDVSPSATPEEIERAYRLATATYTDRSLACYSIYDDREVEALRDRIETAFKVLGDADARDAYDRAIGGTAGAEAIDAAGEPRVPMGGVDPDRWREVPLAAPGARVDLPAASEAFRELEADVEEDEGGEFDGGTLRRARLRRGIELETISDVTKVSISNLRHIEEERFTELPATVYVRGFLKAYASTIGLDPQRVATSYIERFEQGREQQSRPRLLGRR